MNQFELARYEAGMKVQDAARAAGISPRTVRRLEDPEFDGRPQAPVAKALAEAYGVSVARLLGLQEDES